MRPPAVSSARGAGPERNHMIYLTTYAPTNRLADRGREHRLGRLLLSAGLQREFGRTWEIEAGENGRPRLWAGPGQPQPPDFNISHTQGLVVCAISGVRVGVDAQIILPRRRGLERRALAPPERELLLRTGEEQGQAAADELFTRLWTLKESYVKATGAGLSVPLDQVVFAREGGVWRGNTPGFYYRQTRVYRRYIITICLQTSGETQPLGDESERGLKYDISEIV